jgi:hypothetical protein
VSYQLNVLLAIPSDAMAVPLPEAGKGGLVGAAKIPFEIVWAASRSSRIRISFDPNTALLGLSNENPKCKRFRHKSQLHAWARHLSARRQPFPHCSGAGGLRDGKQRVPANRISR